MKSSFSPEEDRAAVVLYDVLIESNMYILYWPIRFAIQKTEICTRSQASNSLEPQHNGSL
jgi:hypothetical protein